MGTVHPVLVAGEWRAPRNARGSFQAFDPQTGEALPGEFPVSSLDELAEMLAAGAAAAEALETLPVDRRRRFFELYADAIDAARDRLAAVAHRETALPVSPRLLQVEMPRTTGQLRMAAAVLADEAWRGRVIDAAAGLMSEFHQLGAPVLVVGPNNFPFAFNAVSGGDFAAALAAGNPVIAKAHPLHPGTTRLLAELCAASLAEAGLPGATVQMFYHCGPEDGLRLAGDRALGAIAFTGSREAGLRLKAAADATGVPFYGELSATNPVFLLPDAVEQRGDQIASELVASVTAGCGQFCTRPGIVVLVDGAPGLRFVEAVRGLVEEASSQVLLGAAVRDRFAAVCQGLVGAGARPLARARATAQRGFVAEPAVFEVGAEVFLSTPGTFQCEAFGPMTLVVRARDEGQVMDVARALDGTLTASVYGSSSPRDQRLFDRLRPLLLRRCGRLVTGKMPTGVTVSPAMNHGGPWPATTHPGFTAVGLPRAMQRFLALKCFDPAPAPRD